MNLKNKKVLLVGLGVLGGGLSMAKYLIKEEVNLTITDLRSKDELKETTKLLPKDARLTLGKHLKSDFDKADLVIFNPAVPYESEWVKYCRINKIEFYNDYTFFIKNIKEINPNAIIIGTTGTRGKTTTTMWTHHLIPHSVIGGNIPEAGLLKILKKKTSFFVLELSSFQLEFVKKSGFSPDIAILTNIYIDHLNRYKKFEKYRDIKFNIFKNQTSSDALILNYDERITKEALKLKPSSHIFFTSLKPLPKNTNGLFFEGDKIKYQYNKKITNAGIVRNLAPHEKANLMMAMLAAHISGTAGPEINRLIKKLPQPKFRQEPILDYKGLKIINDSAGTNPDATIAAIEKFRNNKNFILICGGTNKELSFMELARKIKQNINIENLFLLEGSGTNLLISELKKIKYLPKGFTAYENLEEIVDIISQEFTKGTIVFSPASASFEKFKNEFDRGEKFNKLVKKYFN